ncbi:IcmF-related protein [Rhodovulum sp. P5]|uniref:type VI secretion system membrane subunit TssM n=1 Tax=Rhodovulum sp. P5 TaxID=1564506 RepID=UPI0009C2C1B6|nr:type VI secretion system membrane subunit TssM [Rhodovulum sp. P5]ARE41193.1 IcmF-related protein [Rhodovulum sp. P5]
MRRGLFTTVGHATRRLGAGVVGHLWGVIGTVSLSLVILYGLPATGIAALADLPLRLSLLAALLVVIGGSAVIGTILKRRRARAFEARLMPALGDRDILADRMDAALARLKRAGGRNYLYALPWYVIVGPPGAGKTTALRYSGVEFPGQDLLPDHAQGFGGTRNCDWWFARQAVLIDTAGRYMTRETDRAADTASWAAFLDLLHTHRPHQPINGVILAFSIEDLMRGTPEFLNWHAATMRERLAEMHATLGIDIPVHVLFTKADLISGFRECFGGFSKMQRRDVWGCTFQGGTGKDPTYQRVGEEFDALVRRLSDLVVGWMAREPDSATRIAAFGLPEQMALLRPRVEDFLQQVFAPPRQGRKAILRGFYFTSGTQEGTPVDQILGLMSRESGKAQGPLPAFMSGTGKSFFLHDLMTKVIFAERDWVIFDRRAGRRARFWRRIGLGLTGMVTAGTMAGLGLSYWQNASLVRDAEAGAAVYLGAARAALVQSVIEDPDPLKVLPHLDALRQLPGGYGAGPAGPFRLGFGLSRQREIGRAARQAYCDGLERLLRPRLMLHLENELPRLVIAGDAAALYRALRVYMLLAHDPEARGNGDAAIRSYFAQAWRGAMPAAEAAALEAHLAVMLSLDGDRAPSLRPDEGLKAAARAGFAGLPLTDRVLTVLEERAFAAGVPDLVLPDRIGADSAAVFRTTDTTALGALAVPGLYTAAGFAQVLGPDLGAAAELWRSEQWVRGDTPAPPDTARQLAVLRAAVAERYRQRFDTAWRDLFDRLALKQPSADPPDYARLGLIASPERSPLLQLMATVAAETRLTDTTVGADDIAMLAQAISADFADWHALTNGAPGQRPADAVIDGFGALHSVLATAARAPSPADDDRLSRTLAALSAQAGDMPAPIARMIAATVADIRTDDPASALSAMNAALAHDITAPCRAGLARRFPFADGPEQVGPGDFAAGFAPGGRMDRFVADHLRPYVIERAEGLRPDLGTAIGQRLRAETLARFDAAKRIQRAYFPDGMTTPRVAMSIRLEAASPAVARADLTLQGAAIALVPGGPAADVVWTGAGTGVKIALYGAQSEPLGTFDFAEGNWDVARWLRRAAPHVQGNTVALRQDINGHSVGFRLRFAGDTVPFLMPELGAFRCPETLD